MAPIFMMLYIIKDIENVFIKSNETEFQENNVNEDQNGGIEESVEIEVEDENNTKDQQQNSNNNEDLEEKNSFKNVYKCCYNYVEKMDIPLNRFLIFTGYYFVFIGMILTTILLKNDVQDDSHREFRYYYFFLTFYAITMFWNDIHCMVSLKSFKTFFKFWRVYDLTMHILLVIGKKTDLKI